MNDSLKSLAVSGVIALSLFGCSSPAVVGPSPSTASPSGTASPSDSSTASPSPTSTATQSPSQSAGPSDCLSQEEAIAVLRKTDGATSAGFTERYFDTDGVERVLILNPAQEDSYTAAWFDTATGEGELVFDGLTFSYSFGLVALTQSDENDEYMFPNVSFECTEGGFAVATADADAGFNFGYRYFVGSEGLLESAVGLDGGSETGLRVNYEYSVEQRWIDGLDALVEELLSDF